MNRRWRLAALGACSLCIPLVSGCGSYDKPAPAAAGQAGTSGSAGSAGNSSAGNGGQSGTGGAAGSGGQAGTAGGGQAGTAGSGGASCTNVTGCGGAVVGTWNATSSCLQVSGELDPGVINLMCTPTVTGSLNVTGTFTANADGTYTDGTTTSGNETISLGAACLFLSGTTFTCDRLGGPMQTYGYSMVTCVDAAGGGCTCAATVDQSGGMALVSTNASPSGTYATASNVLTATSGQDNTAYPYCVSASTLTLSLQGAGKTGTVTGTVVLQKQ